MTNFPHFDVEKSIIKKFFLAYEEKFGKYDLKNGFGKYYFSSRIKCMAYILTILLTTTAEIIILHKRNKR